MGGPGVDKSRQVNSSKSWIGTGTGNIIASATFLRTPGMCSAAKVKVKRGAADNSLGKRYIIHGTLEVLEERMWTTASLSDRNKICLWNSEGPRHEML